MCHGASLVCSRTNNHLIKDASVLFHAVVQLDFYSYDHVMCAPDLFLREQNIFPYDLTTIALFQHIHPAIYK
jgi:hypothetical protein